jgi:hypothetical protein
VHVHATFTDLSGTTVAPGRTDTSISAATTTDVVASPGASTTRKIKFLSLFNDHATAAQDIVIRHTDGTTAVDLWAGSVPAQSGVTFAEKGGWQVSAPFPSADIQTFDAPGGTWNKPTGQKTGLTLIRLWGGGGGGGGGASLATAVVAKGGSGGGGAGCVSHLFLTDELPDTLTVIIGFGGGGGEGAAAGGAGNGGAQGGSSSVRTPGMALLTAFGGNGGGRGNNGTENTAGGAGSGTHTLAGAVSSAAAACVPISGNLGTATAGPSWEGGGGGGGSSNSATVPPTGEGVNARFGGGGGGSGGCHSNVPAVIEAKAGGGTGNSVGATAAGLGGAAGTSGAAPTNGANGIDTDGISGGTGGGGGWVEPCAAAFRGSTAEAVRLILAIDEGGAAGRGRR